MIKFVVSASKDECHDRISCHYRIYESSDFPIIGDDLDVEGDFFPVDRRYHWKVNGTPIIVVAVTVDDYRWKRIKESADWKGAIEEVMASL